MFSVSYKGFISKQTIIYLLLFSLLNYIGCTSTVFVTVNEYEPKALKENTPSGIYITTYDSKKYHFNNDEYFYIKNDTLYAKGKVAEYEIINFIKVKTGRMITIEHKFPPGEIKSIEEANPNEINVITTSNKEYHFENKGYYYIENDTLYGQGEIYLQEVREYFKGKIALSNIKSVYSGIIIKGEDAEDEIILERQNESEGTEITVLLKNSTEICGELLSVRDSSIIICREYSAAEEELSSLKYPINNIRNNEIEEMTIEGSSYVLTGVGVGLIVGTALGYYVAKKMPPCNRCPVGGDALTVLVAGIIGGPIVGGIVGIVNSKKEIILSGIPHGYDWSLFKSLARYPEEEPEYLKTIK